VTTYVRWFDELGKDDTPVAGGKGANLGEMTHAGLPVPPGFVVTAEAYRAFIQQAGLADLIEHTIAATDVDDRRALVVAADAVQARIRAADVPSDVVAAVTDAYRELSRREGGAPALVAVRSSATMDDTAEASLDCTTITRGSTAQHSASLWQQRTDLGTTATTPCQLDMGVFMTKAR
jgi:pyruvate,water dikinase